MGDVVVQQPDGSFASTASAVSAASEGKAPRTRRGERTLRKLLDAARVEFGDNGFSDTSIVAITQRAKVALGTFYTYFDSKEAVFREVVSDMSGQVRDHVAPALAAATGTIDGERRALQSFLEFARTHRDVYRIIDEAEFVEPSAYKNHYETTASRIAARLKAGRASGEIAADLTDCDLDVLGWALMGANVFLGLKYALWDEADPAAVARVTSLLLRSGISK